MRAASSNPTTTTNLLRANGVGEQVASGDWVTDATAPALNNAYRFFIEVPPGLPNLVVEVFDADVGRGGNNEGTRDLLTGGAFNTAVIYTLLRPDGTQQGGTVTCSSANTPAVCVDNAWSALFGSVANPVAGHWQLVVDPSNANGQNGDETMGYGVRAHDGDAGGGGVEIPVYADSYLGLGPTTATQQVNVFHPWVTSGCTARSNDFDADSTAGTNYSLAGNVGFSQQFTTVSANSTWRSNATGAYTSDNTAQNYGVWTATADVRKGGNAAANVITYYVASQFAATAGTGNPQSPRNQPEPGAFRLYLPTDGGGVPVKPIVEQFARTKNGPNPPVAGQTSTITITVRVTNPTARAITFSAANVVTSTVPAGAQFAGNIAATQGSTTSPGVGGTGTVTWNPGVVAAGAVVLLAYDVNVTPAAAGRIVVTGATAAGTTARYVDETGNTTQARSTFTFGPLCELAVTVGTLTWAAVVDVHAVRDPASGAVDVAWRTSGEAGTVGFSLLRDVGGGEVALVDQVPSPRLPQGARYVAHDEGAAMLDDDDVHALSYWLVEHDGQGRDSTYGPYALEDAPVASSRPSLDVRLWPDFSNAGALPARDPRIGPRSFSADATASPPDLGSVVDNVAPPIGARLVAPNEDGLVSVPLELLAATMQRSPSELEGLAHSGGLAVRNDGVVVGSEARDGFLVFFARATPSPFARGRTYFVTAGVGEVAGVVDGGGAGADLASMTPTLSAAPVTSVLGEDLFPGSVADLDPFGDVFFWASMAAGYDGYNRFDTSANVEAGDGADITFVLQGASNLADNDHHVRLSVNGAVVDDFTFTGLERVERTVHLAGPLASPLALGVEAVWDYVDVAPKDGHDDNGHDELFALRDSSLFVDSIQVRTDVALDASAPRSFDAHAGDVVGVGAGGAPLWLYRVDVQTAAGDLVGLARVDGAANVGGELRALLPEEGRYAYAPAARPSPGFKLSAVAPSSLTSTSGADVVVIAPRALAGAADELAAWQLVRGHVSRVVDVQDIFDAFAGGDADPRALQRFVVDARERWDSKPRFVVLLGDGDIDYRDDMGFAKNFVPPITKKSGTGIAAADALVADVDGDGVIDLGIGRIPARSTADVDEYIAVASAFEGPAAALFLADKLDTTHGADFEAITTSLATQVSLPAQRMAQAPDIDIDGDGIIDVNFLADARAAFFAAVGRGQLVTFVGHGGMDRIGRDGIVMNADEATMRAKGPYALVALTCIINRFELPDFQGLGEELMRNGGAALILAPASETTDAFADQFGAYFFARLAQGGAAGDVMVDAERAFVADGGDPSLLSSYVLLGDPTLTLAAEPSTSSSCASVHASDTAAIAFVALLFARRRRRRA